MRHGRRYIWEEDGLQLEIEPLRFRITVRSDCPADVRAALSGVECEGRATDLADAERRGLVALGRVLGWVLARRRPEQQDMLSAEQAAAGDDAAATYLEAAHAALEAGRGETATAIVARGRDWLRRAGRIRTGIIRRAQALADATAAEMRRRGQEKSA